MRSFSLAARRLQAFAHHLPLGIVLVGCSSGAPSEGPSSNASSSGAGGATATSSTTTSASSGSGGMGDPPSGHLLLSATRLIEIEALAATNAPAFASLRALVDSHLGGGSDLWHDSPENAALVYLATKDPTYAKAAYAWEKSMVDGFNVRFDSYLEFGDAMRRAALVLDWCGAALSTAERAVLADYLEHWTHELWFDNQGSGWGLDDPGNNYHHAFLEGTAYAAYALAREGRPSATTFRALLDDKLAKPGGVLDYLAVKGGDWREGANYGERSKQRLASALAVVASMGGTNHFHAHPWFSQAIVFAHYQLQPDRSALAPAGDLARDSAMTVTAAERDYLATMASFLGDGTTRRLARRYLDEFAPPFKNPYAGLAWKDLVFAVPGPAANLEELPPSDVAPGTGFVHWRSGSDSSATAVTLSAPSVIEQSHQHHDAGSLLLFERGWLAMDAATFSKSGLTWSPGSHSGIHVAGAERRMGAAGGLLRHEDAGAHAYAAIDATAQYRRSSGGVESTLMTEVSREVVYLRPDVVVVYDRVTPKDASRFYEWRLHVPTTPKLGATVTVTGQNAGLSLVPLLAGAVATASDADLEEGGSSAFRVTEAATGTTSRFLNVLATADGGPPTVAASRLGTSGELEAAEVGGVVVVFSRRAFGAPAALPAWYELAGTAPREHVVVDVGGPLKVTSTLVGDRTRITLEAGGALVPSAAGVVTFKR